MIADPNKVVLRMASVTAGYGRRPVLAGVSLDIRHGEVLAVMGPSGCGKSTLVRVVAKLLAPTSGHVTCHNAGTEDVAVMFQHALLQPWLNVTSAVALPARLRNTQADVTGLLRAVRLQGLEQRYPFQLSGGEQRRVALARALAQSPSLLCLDEPFSGVDELTREELLALVSRVLSERGLPCLLVTHSPLESVFLADRVVVLGGSPTTIVGELPIEMPQPRQLSVLDGHDFQAIVRRVSRMLREGAQ